MGACRAGSPPTELDRLSGELHAIAYYWGWDHVQHIVIDAGGTVSRTVNVSVKDGPMMHDFALTENYLVLLDLPVTFSLDAVSAGSSSLTPGTRSTTPASESCLSTGAEMTSDGSTSSRVSSSIPSTATRTRVA